MSEQIDSYEGPTGDSALVRLLYPTPADRRPGAILSGGRNADYPTT